MPGDGLELEHFLPYRLSVLANTVSSALAATYGRRFKLRIPEWRVLAVLGSYPDSSAGEVARRTAMDKVAVSRAVGRLIDSGRVRRETDPQDRRRSVLELTAQGRRIYERITPVLLRYERELLATLPAPERRQLVELLKKLQAGARRLGPPLLD